MWTRPRPVDRPDCGAAAARSVPSAGPTAGCRSAARRHLVSGPLHPRPGLDHLAACGGRARPGLARRSRLVRPRDAGLRGRPRAPLSPGRRQSWPGRRTSRPGGLLAAAAARRAVSGPGSSAGRTTSPTTRQPPCPPGRLHQPTSPSQSASPANASSTIRSWAGSCAAPARSSDFAAPRVRNAGSATAAGPRRAARRSARRARAAPERRALRSGWRNRRPARRTCPPARRG